jgi:nucleoside-diphosphate-sugar epimerase
MNAADVLRAAQGACLIVHAVNPPGYRDWNRLVLPMLDHTIAAAKAVGARILFPGSIYNFGRDAFPVLHENSAQVPTTRKGAIRMEIEKRLKAASEAGVPTLILRAGDYFGPTTKDNSYFSALMVRSGAPVRRIIEPARWGASHAWAYLPDVAETFARLMDRETALSDFEIFHFSGHQLAPGEMAAAIAKAVGKPHLRVWPFPWPLIVALQPFVRLFYEMAEMRHLWSETVSLDGGKLKAFLGSDLPATPLASAVEATLAGLGCLHDGAGYSPDRNRLTASKNKDAFAE